MEKVKNINIDYEKIFGIDIEDSFDYDPIDTNPFKEGDISFAIDPRKYSQLRTTVSELSANRYIVITAESDTDSKKKYEVIIWRKKKTLLGEGWDKVSVINEIRNDPYLVIDVHQVIAEITDKEHENSLDDILIEYRVNKVRSFLPDERIPAHAHLIADDYELQRLIKKAEDTAREIEEEQKRKKSFLDQLNAIFGKVTILILLIAVVLFFFLIRGMIG